MLMVKSFWDCERCVKIAEEERGGRASLRVGTCGTVRYILAERGGRASLGVGTCETVRYK